MGRWPQCSNCIPELFCRQTTLFSWHETVIGSLHIYEREWPVFLTKTLVKVHYNDVIMGAIASQITSLTIVYSTVYSGAGQRKHESSVLLAFERGIHRGPVNSPHKWSVTRKMFPFDDVIMIFETWFRMGWQLSENNQKPCLKIPVNPFGIRTCTCSQKYLDGFIFDVKLQTQSWVLLSLQ